MEKDLDNLVDPRARNERIFAETPSDYLKSYLERLNRAIDAVTPQAMDQAFALMRNVIKRQSIVYVVGNGGSSAVCDHMSCDWMKGTHVPGKPALRVLSLSSNLATMTALANDFGYEHSLSKQVEMLGKSEDVLVAISCSGNSANIVQAVKIAKEKQMTVLGLSGFSGGQVKELSDISLHVPAENYGIVEDCHQILMHVLGQFLAGIRDRGEY